MISYADMRMCVQ